MQSPVDLDAIKQLLRPLKRSIQRHYIKFKYRQRLRQPVHWLSLGENCLPDDILKRHERKVYSSPFSTARTNIDYAIQLEADGYRHLLSSEHLVRAQVLEDPVVRSTYYARCDDIFHASCAQGFEFSHHDPIARDLDRKGFERKIARLKLGRQNGKHFIFLYHHRWSEKSDLPLLRQKLSRFRSFYAGEQSRCAIVLFYQTLVASPAERRLEHRLHDDMFIEFNFHTQDSWAGEVQDLFWARVDDDLIRRMLAVVDATLPLAGGAAAAKHRQAAPGHGGALA